ncbi:hypothetical protein PybrP1_012019 [[Pythium] brassicae (nom. inval.)]|nr:hypothetical protein PybrP1_012019 [[Pythium] brassicae (nom. inval.)]
MALLKQTLLLAAAAALLLAAGDADAAGALTYPKCPAGASGCCDFGSGQMKSPGYAVVRFEVDTIVTCSHGKLTCFEGNPNLRAGSEGRNEIPCPDFASLEESRSAIEFLDGVKAAPKSSPGNAGVHAA